MPTDTLPASAFSVETIPLPLKPERLSPEFESSSPSVSPHSPNPARAFPSAVGLGFGGLRTPVPPSSTGLACGASALKQMEMMTRNYSEFMRSLAAKYNNQNSQESFSFVQPNGIARPFEGHLSYKGGTPPLLGRNSEPPENSSRKLENHLKSSPILGESRSVPFSFGDFSSSQTLLNLVRTASAKSASQLENYLRGANKRPFESDPLDLTMGATKRPRLGTPDASPHRCLYLPISRDIRDIIGSIKTDTDIIGSIKTDTDALSNTHNDTRSKDSFRKTSSWTNLLEGRLLRSESSSAQASPKSSDRGRCPSFCTDQSCLNISDASEIAQWTVDDVVKFVMSVESCAEYADNFREQSIDGSSLPLLSEDHLKTYLGMKLGPALKLRSTVAKKIGHCVVCMHCIHCHSEEYEKQNEWSTLGK
ncbi:polyhomeotic-like protein 2 [Limulus polyphemus]|uniref:Polyhomeotic-like protein 2 n=1 Tax=Limulus polyphemus TaxID=6850 RepID=A0ABM1BL43_LIMPO|nr:polyhomeotic-like protein 2 [Limulus polyphemus]